ncbi:MAG: SDR family NAD(P)-dependent oxidoreductase [Colwellia sp.]|nr:SDR family NAD(P)-dependent oxidoreductase [Colwellia sp.]
MNSNEYTNDIAIIGMAGRFPGAGNIHEYWKNLCNGEESIKFFSDHELLDAGVDPELINNPDYVKAMPVLDDIELFDARLFGFSPKEAEIIDPQHRLFLETSWEALEDAGYRTDLFNGRIGVYGGVGINFYLLNNIFSNQNLIKSFDGIQLRIANDKDFLCTRVCYLLNLKGPGLNINTACSTSLVAVQLALQGLLNFQCDIALAGGSTIMLPQPSGYLYREGGILSPDGHCRAFDRKARGTIGGSGVGVVVLKRMEDALADNDHIYAVIKGAAVNNDGSLKVGYTAPGQDGQAEVIAEAQAIAGVSPETITYIETHGTGTAIGDPIEISALNRVFRRSTQKKSFCAIGSVKTNIGHLDAAAGVASLIKTALALKHKKIPPSLHYESPNPQIDFENSPFFVNTCLSDWGTNGTMRRAGVSSFGIGGTNAHIVLEEAPTVSPELKKNSNNILILSANTETALKKLSSDMSEFLKKNNNVSLENTAYTLQVGRSVMNYKKAVVCKDIDQAISGLEKYTCSIRETKDRPVIFMFSGQGAQYPNMGLGLYKNQSVFRKYIDFCSEFLISHINVDLRDIIYPGRAPGSCNEADILNRTNVAQPALFAIEYALAMQWMEWGIKPQAMIGHSIGEYTAAAIAEVFSLENALSIVGARGKIMHKLPAGSMLAVNLSETELKPFIDNSLSFACVNGSQRCVVSGETGHIEQLQSRLEQQSIICKKLRTSHGFHSTMMDPIVEEFKNYVAQFKLNAPKIPYISNLTGDWITPEQAIDPTYWAMHLRNTVRFSDGIDQLLKEPEAKFLEIGPGRTLSSLVKTHTKKGPKHIVVNSIKHPKEDQDDEQFILDNLGKLWLSGLAVDWPALYEDNKPGRISLPTYPFDRKRYWIEPLKLEDQSNQVRLDIKNKDIGDWFYIPSWNRSIIPAQKDHKESETFIIMANETGISDTLLEKLKNNGNHVITINTGSRFKDETDSKYTINPGDPNDYMTQMDQIAIDNKAINIIHLWSLTGDEKCNESPEWFKKLQETGYYSLLFLAQALDAKKTGVKVNITVISNNIHEVTGDELLFAAKATIQGPLKVIQQELPDIRCRNIDVIYPHSNNALLIDILYQEIISGVFEEPVVAYRGNNRWVQTYQQVRLDKPVNQSSGFRERGVYLITGGLGEVGLVLAQYLARTRSARVVLTGRSELPPENEWQNWLLPEKPERSSFLEKIRDKTNITNDLETETDKIISTEKQIRKGFDIKNDYSIEFAHSMDELCMSYIYRYFLENGINTENSYKKADLIKQLKIIPKFEKFLDFFLKVLSDDNAINIDGDEIEFIKDRNQIGDADIKYKELRNRFPDIKAGIAFIDHCVKHYKKALSGEIEAIEVIYPEGCSDLLNQVDEATTDPQTTMVYMKLLTEEIIKIVDREKSKKIRILEVGGGNGYMTELLSEAIKDRNNVEYYFTDIGRSFVLNAEKKAKHKGHGFMKFSVLDISEDGHQQGMDKYSFDIIFGLNVVHATKSIKESIANLRKLLKPNGIMAVIETVRSDRWVNMIWGLAEGWWYFEDKEIREYSPLLDIDKWDKVFKDLGFGFVKSFPVDNECRMTGDCGLVIAQENRKINTEDYINWINKEDKKITDQISNTVQKLNIIKNIGGEVMVVDADVANLQEMETAIEKTYQRFGQLNGVIHAAGITSGESIFSFLGEISRSESEYQFSPKVYGVYVLEQLLRNKNLDFCLLVSSNASVLGGLGLIAYSASNIFMDAFAINYNRISNTPWISTTWDGWPTEEAMKRGDKTETSIDKYEMTVVESEEAVERIVSSVITGQVVVSAGDLQPRLDLWTRLTTHQPFDNTDETVSKSLHNRPDLRTDYVSPEDEIEQRIVIIWQELLGISEVGRNDNFFEMGGDSLIGIQLISRINKEFSIDLAMKLLFENPTPAAIAEHVEQKESSDSAVTRPIEPIPSQKYYDLSHSQKRMWVLSQIEGGSIAYNIVLRLLLHGDIDYGAFGNAFNSLIKRHESLRTTFIVVNGEPKQEVHDNINFKVNIIDLRNDPKPDNKANDLASNDSMRAFDLEKGPLIRVSLLRLDDKKHLMLLTMHHIISDGWSLSLLINEFSCMYNSIFKGENISLPPLAIQYRDYAYWQNKLLKEEAMAVHREYWHNKLSGDIPVPDLPIDFPRSNMQSFRGNMIHARLTEEQTEKLRAFNTKNGISLFIFSVAAVKAVLYHYTGQDDIIVGSPIAGRNHYDLENQIGLYLNTLVLRDNVNGEKSFEVFLKRVRQTITEAFDHQIYPFDVLVDELALERDFSRTPLFDVMVNLLLKDSSFNPEMGSLKTSPYLEDVMTTMIDVNFMFEERDDNIIIMLQYNVDLFKEETMRSMADHLIDLIDNIIKEHDPKRALNSFFDTEENLMEEEDFIKCTMDLNEDF